MARNSRETREEKKLRRQANKEKSARRKESKENEKDSQLSVDTASTDTLSKYDEEVDSSKEERIMKERLYTQGLEEAASRSVATVEFATDNSVDQYWSAMLTQLEGDEKKQGVFESKTNMPYEHLIPIPYLIRTNDPFPPCH